MKIYHGIKSKNYHNMLKHGVRADSYWGIKELAMQYSDCGKVIEIDTSDYEYSIKPNETVIENYATNDVGNEDYLKWLELDQTWESSLEIFGSVIIDDDIIFNKSQIIE